MLLPHLMKTGTIIPLETECSRIVMQLISVNIGKKEPIQNAKAWGHTGIFKRPVDVPVQVNPLGLAGDHISDVENHGGFDQAVYVYSTLDYDWWSAELGRRLEPGTFGENLTISDLETLPIRIGDRLHFAQVVLEVTGPRIPCVTLAARMGDPQFLKRFVKAERPGLYCRVIAPGAVQVGETVTLTPYVGETFASIESFRMFHQGGTDDPAIVRRLLAAPIDIRSRRYYEAKLQELEK
jgi:MOSC domain-containing protein YiiM